jgi:hypothetical protein
VGRQEAVALVEDDEGAEAARAGQAAGVREDFLEQDAEDEGAFVVVEVGDADDDGGGAAVLGGEPLADVEGAALAPAGEGGGGEQGVEGGGEALAILEGRKSLTSRAPTRSMGGLRTSSSREPSSAVWPC